MTRLPRSRDSSFIARRFDDRDNPTPCKRARRPVPDADARGLRAASGCLHLQRVGTKESAACLVAGASGWGNRSRSLVLGALHDEILCGVVGLSFQLRDKERHKASLFGMYVPARCRRLGLGNRLVTAALALARARPGVRLVQLTVTQGNVDARRLYEKCGFDAYGVEPDAISVGGSYFSKVHMWCDLNLAPDARRATPGPGMMGE